MKARDIKIPSFLKVSEKDALQADGKFNATIEGIPSISDVSETVAESELKLNGRCDQFDLTRPEDRERYANLCARFLTPCGCEKLWEERVPTEGGGMMVYVAFTELSAVSYNTAIELKDKEGK